MKISLKKYAEALAVVLEKEKDSGQAAQKINNILKLLARRKQSRLIKGLPEVFRKIWLEKQKKVELTATTPYESSEEDLKDLTKLIKDVLQKEVFIKNKVDKNIIGGIKLEFDDYIVDATLATDLKNLKQKIA